MRTPPPSRSRRGSFLNLRRRDDARTSLFFLRVDVQQFSQSARSGRGAGNAKKKFALDWRRRSVCRSFARASDARGQKAKCRRSPNLPFAAAVAAAADAVCCALYSRARARERATRQTPAATPNERWRQTIARRLTRRRRLLSDFFRCRRSSGGTEKWPLVDRVVVGVMRARARASLILSSQAARVTTPRHPTFFLLLIAFFAARATQEKSRRRRRCARCVVFVFYAREVRGHR